MPNWKLRAAVQGGIALLPYRQTWNRLLQKYVTKTLDLNTETFEYKLTLVNEHVSNYLETASSPKDSFSVLELGTGWHPVIPVGLWLCGASKVWTIDKVSLLIPPNVRSVLRRLVEHAGKGDLIEKLPRLREDRLDDLREACEDKSLKTAGKMLERLNIFPVIADARDTGLEPASIDLFVSNATFEHIPGKVLPDILKEFRRLAAPEAVMSHQIDLSDHYRGLDSTITPLNFLKYPDFIWKFFSSTLYYQNRVLLSDYRKMHQDAGFKILREQNRKCPREVLDKISPAKRFRHYSPDDLLVINSRIISVPDEMCVDR